MSGVFHALAVVLTYNSATTSPASFHSTSWTLSPGQFGPVGGVNARRGTPVRVERPDSGMGWSLSHAGGSIERRITATRCSALFGLGCLPRPSSTHAGDSRAAQTNCMQAAACHPPRNDGCPQPSSVRDPGIESNTGSFVFGCRRTGYPPKDRRRSYCGSGRSASRARRFAPMSASQRVYSAVMSKSTFSSSGVPLPA